MMTLILLSRNTSSYLTRALNYYVQVGFKGRVFIADSSSELERIEVRTIVTNFQNATFFPLVFEYDHKTTFVEKISFVMQHVCTPYVLLASVDDFFSIQTLREGMFFLRDNPDFSYVSGYVYGYTYQPSGIDWYYTGDSYYPRSFEQDDPIDRIECFLQRYTSVIHTLFKTEILKIILGSCLKYANDPCGKFFENMVTTQALLLGKGKYLPVPFAWREQRQASAGSTYHEKWLLDENFEDDARLMELGIKEVLRQFLRYTSENAALKSKEIVRKFVEYHFNCIFPTERLTKFSVQRLIKQSAPLFLVNNLKLIRKMIMARKRYRISGEHFLYAARSPYHKEFMLINKLIEGSKIYASRVGIESLKIDSKHLKMFRSVE